MNASVSASSSTVPVQSYYSVSTIANKETGTETKSETEALGEAGAEAEAMVVVKAVAMEMEEPLRSNKSK